MKKIILLITLCVSLIIPLSLDNHVLASEVTNEVLSLDLNNTLIDGSSNPSMDSLTNISTLDFDLTSALNNSSFFIANEDYIRKMYLEIVFDVSLNNNSGNFHWVSDDEFFLSTTSDIEYVKYVLKPWDLDYTPSFDVWIEDTSVPGLPQGMPRRFVSAAIKVEFEIPVDNYDVDSNYVALPDSEDKIGVSNIELYDELSRSYRITFNKLNSNDVLESFTFNVALPEVIDLSNFRNRDTTWNVYYQTVNDDDNSRLLIFEDAITNDKLFAMNLTLMEYQQINKLELYSVIDKVGYNTAFMYCFYDFRVEDILSIQITFKWRTTYISAFKGDWNYEDKIYYQGEDSDDDTPHWLTKARYLVATESNSEETLEVVSSITREDIPDDVMNIYLYELNGLESDLDNLNLYSIPLGSFHEPFSTGFDIDNVVVQNITYIYQGYLLYATFEEIDQENITPGYNDGIGDLIGIPPISDWINPFESLISTIKTILTVVILLVILYVIIKAINYFRYMKLFGDVRTLKNASNKSKVTKSNRR